MPDLVARLHRPLEHAEVDDGAAELVVVTDPVSQALLRTPGELGADIVVAEGQPLGNAPSFGGPVVGLFAARQKLVRKMPGRIVGATVDMEDRRGYVLTLQTREQQIHIVAEFHANKIRPSRIAYRVGIDIAFIEALIAGEEEPDLFPRLVSRYSR